jgi:hypothetical protein
MQPTIHLESKLSASISRFALQMYCGLHFQFRRTHYHSWNILYLGFFQLFLNSLLQNSAKKQIKFNSFFSVILFLQENLLLLQLRLLIFQIFSKRVLCLFI